MSSPKSHALTLIAETKFAPPGANLNTWGQNLSAQFDLIDKAQSEAAVRATFVGIALDQTKASLPHGSFGPWLKKHFSEKSRRQVNYYMRLGLVALEETKAKKTELLAVSDGKFELDRKDPAATRFIASIKDFVADLSLNELLIKHGIKSVGLKSSLSGEAEEDENLSPAEQLKRERERIFGETANHLQLLRKILTTAEHLQLLDPSELVSIDRELADLRSAIAACRPKK